MKSILSIGLLVMSNTFMTFAWYDHLFWYAAAEGSQLTLPYPSRGYSH